MRSLKCRIFFAHASIMYMKTGKRKKQEFIAPQSPTGHVKNDAGPPTGTIYRSRISVVMKRRSGWLFEVPCSKIVDLHYCHNAARIFLVRNFIHTICIARYCRMAYRNICKFAILLRISEFAYFFVFLEIFHSPKTTLLSIKYFLIVAETMTF